MMPERLWLSIAIPGVVTRWTTYWPADLDAMPRIGRRLDGSLDWLLGAPVCRPSLEEEPEDGVSRSADATGLREVAGALPLSAAFRQFIEEPRPRRHLRSATTSFLDLGEFPVLLRDGGRLIHFLADQQWVLHWLLHVRADGREQVVVTPHPLGFDATENAPLRSLDVTELGRLGAVCADSFEEFLYRLWVDNELFFRLGVDRVTAAELPEELRSYLEAYPAEVPTSLWDETGI